MTREDYDELKRLRDDGCMVVTKEIRWIVMGESKRGYHSTRINPDIIPDESRKLNIKRAIADYEREHKEDA